MLKYILLFLLMPCFAQGQYYTASQILNKVLVSSTAIKGTLNETQVLNLVYNPNASALNVRLDTNTATSPYVLKTGDIMTGSLTIDKATMTITGNAFSVGTSTFVISNGNVGIGTTTPVAKLDVNGKINANNDIGTNLGNYTKPSFIQDGSIIANAQGLSGSKGSFVGAVVQNVTGAFGGHFISWSNSTNPDWLIGLSKNVAGADTGNLYYMADSAAANIRLTLMKNGNVGIGTTTPNSKLQVVSGIINVSTSTTSSVHLCLAGAFNTLPTSGYNKGCLAYQNSDNKLYVSTETVVSSYSWKPLW